MTNLEAILGYFNKKQGAELMLLNEGLVSTEDYVIANEQSVEIASAHLRISAIGAADIKETDASKTWGDNDSLISSANYIFKKYGLPIYDGDSVVVNVDYPWTN